MVQVEERKVEIRREFNYSNSAAETRTISFLAQYCDSYYKQLIKCVKKMKKKMKIKILLLR